MTQIITGIPGVEIIACDERDPSDQQFFYARGHVDAALFASEVARWAGYEDASIPVSHVMHGLLREYRKGGDFDFTVEYAKRRSKNAFEATWVWVG